jgi:integrase
MDEAPYGVNNPTSPLADLVRLLAELSKESAFFNEYRRRSRQDVFVDYKTPIKYTESLLDRGKLRCPDDRQKVLSNQQIEDLLVYTSTTRNPERNRVIVLLSVKAGLRAGEIAKQM